MKSKLDNRKQIADKNNLLFFCIFTFCVSSFDLKIHFLIFQKQISEDTGNVY